MQSQVNVSLEMELLILCVRHALTLLSKKQADPDIIAGIRKFITSPSLNWQVLIDLANRHRVTPLLYYSLALKTYVISSEVERSHLSSMQRIQLGNAARNIRYVEKLFDILDLFSKAGINSIPFKGPVMACTLYGDHSLRQISDLDFMVNTDDLPRAKKLLEDRGYRAHKVFTPSEQRLWEKTECGYDMTSSDNELTVDIRSRITPDYLPFWLDLTEVLEEVIEVEFEGRKTRTFSPEMQLLLLCYHGTKHLWHRLSWISDIGMIIQSQSINFEKVLHLAERAGGNRVLRIGLKMAETTLGIPLPERMGAWQNEDIVLKKLTGICAMRLESCVPEGTDWRQEYLFYLKMRETLLARTGYLLKILFRPTYSDCALIHLPESLHFLYYFLRPLRLIAKVLRYQNNK